jgi:hypothetical protein
MIYLRKNTIRFRGSNGRRGSVIVLVVAVLALLAVIGTVYIVSARSERTGAVAASAAENLDLARDAVNHEASRIIGDAVIDGFGNVGGLQHPGTFGDWAARNLDMPEWNVAGEASPNGPAREQSWLAAGIYRNIDSAYSLGGVSYVDYTFPQTRMTVTDLSDNSVVYRPPAVFDPATGQYDIPLFQFNKSLGQKVIPSFDEVNGVKANGIGCFRTVVDQVPAIRYDSFVQLLPFSDANGTRYRFGLRIVDTSSMANLNAGLVFDPAGLGVASPTANNYTNLSAIFGTYANQYSLTNSYIFNNADNGNANNIHLARKAGWNPGAPMSGAPLNYQWQYAQYHFENPYDLPTVPYDLSDELELRSFGNVGTLAIPRPASSNIWFNTLSNHPLNSALITRNDRRSFYTTYSYSRDLRPMPDPVDPMTNLRNDYQVLPLALNVWTSNVPPRIVGASNANVWPPAPAKVNALPDISAYASTSPANDQTMADTLVIAATNLATAIREAGYPGFERAFAANYLTSRWSGWGTVDTSGAPLKGYYLKNGPSYLDETGIHFRTAHDDGTLFSVDYKTTLTNPAAGPSPLAGKVLVGYAAQPYLNEVAISSTKDVPNNAVIELDAAVELYNPFNVPLSLEDFAIMVNGQTIDFTGKNLFVPARGYFVLTNSAGKLDSAPHPVPNTPATVQKADVATITPGSTLTIKGATAVILLRKINDGSPTGKWCGVDQFNVAQISNPQPPDGSTYVDFEARPNDDRALANPPSRWVATADDPSFYVKQSEPAAVLTLGTMNSTTGQLSNATPPMYDRCLELFADNAYLGDAPEIRNFHRLLPRNVADFNRIMRLANESDSATGVPTNTVGSQVAAYNSSAPAAYPGSDFPVEAAVYFDFAADGKARRLLDFITFTDRVSDASIDLGDNSQYIDDPLVLTNYSRGLSKLRIPGKINVNTASAEVLSSLPTLYNGLQNQQQLIAAILAFRYRSVNDGNDPRIPAAFTANPPTMQLYDFRATPGYGVRSLAELEIPIIAYQKANNIAYASINERDQLWASLYNSLTVRSDTFIAYAYLEAVRPNPRYTGPAANNGTDWYTVNYDNGSATAPTIGITDDASKSNFSLVRVGRRRWVSIIDRSQADYSRFIPASLNLDPRFTQPRIVAQKDLPR